jgi:hypothetical protein
MFGGNATPVEANPSYPPGGTLYTEDTFGITEGFLCGRNAGAPATDDYQIHKEKVKGG